MKKIKQLRGMHIVSILALSLMSFVSCTTDFPTEIQPNSEKEISTEAISRIAANYPENPENPYDIVGQLSVMILDDYLDLEMGTSTSQSLINQIEGFAQLRLEYQQLVPIDYFPPLPTTIDRIILIDPSDTLAIAKLSEYSMQARGSLIKIIDSLLVFQELQKEEVEIMEFIYNYESSILSNGTFSVLDKKMLLTTTSIARHGLYYAKRRPRRKRDRDWEISWGNMYAAAAGSKDNTAKALIMAVTVGILSNI